MNGVAGDDPVNADSDADGYSDRHQYANDIAVQGSPGGFFRLSADGDQRRFRHGRGKADHQCKEVHVKIVVSGRQLFGHAGANRKQPHLETDHKGIKPQNHQGKTKDDLAWIGKFAAQYQILKEEHRNDDGQNIPNHGDQVQQCADHAGRLGFSDIW